MPRRPEAIQMDQERKQYRIDISAKQSPTGKRKRVRDVGTDYADVIVRYQQIMAELKKEARGESVEATVSDFGPRWLEECIRQQRDPKGHKLSKARFETHIEPVLGNVALREIGQAELRKLASVLKAKKLAPRTVKWILGELRCQLYYAKDCELIGSIPSFRAAMPRVAEKEPNPVSLEEMSLISKDLETRPDELFPVMLSRFTGLRYGETLRPRWRDVIWKPDPYLLLAKTKSKKVRRVPILPEALELLEREQTARRRIPHMDTFISPYRKPDAGWIYRPSNQRISKKLGRPFKWWFHRMRDTFACWFLELGYSPADLQVVLGHSTIQQTEKYGRLSEAAVLRRVRELSIGQSSGQQAETQQGEVR